MMVRSIAVAGLIIGVLGQSTASSQNPGGAAMPAFSQWSTFCGGVEHTTSIALGDLDRDGDLDLIFGNGRHLEETDWVYSNNGRGGFYAKRALGTEADPTYGVALGDLDGDGALDVVVANDAGDPSVSYRNDGKGNFTWLGNVGRTPEARRAVALGDLDGDGDLDVILVGLAQDHIYLNENRGLRWTERPLGTREGAGSRATSVAVGDVDGDKDLDIVLPGRYQAPSNVYVNDGKAGFEARSFGVPADDTTAVALADVDGDRDLDIVVANWQAPHAIYANDGRGGFTSHATFGTGRERTWSVALADMDLDGDLDAVVGNANADYWAQDWNGDARNDLEGHRPLEAPSRVYVNDGTGRMAAGPAFAFGHDNTRPIALGDVDGDGDTDIVMGNDCQPNHVFYNAIRTAQPPAR